LFSGTIRPRYHFHHLEYSKSSSIFLASNSSFILHFKVATNSQLLLYHTIVEKSQRFHHSAISTQKIKSSCGSWNNFQPIYSSIGLTIIYFAVKSKTEAQEDIKAESIVIGFSSWNFSIQLNHKALASSIFCLLQNICQSVRNG
jgi:hypothetical protein